MKLRQQQQRRHRAYQYYDTGSSSDSAALPMRRAELRDAAKLFPATKGRGRSNSFDGGDKESAPPRGNRQSSSRQWHWGAAGSGPSYASASEGEGEMMSGTLSRSTESFSDSDSDSATGSSGSDSEGWSWSGRKLWSRVESGGDLIALLKGVGGDAGVAGNRGGRVGCRPSAMRQYARAIVGAVALAALVVSGMYLVTEVNYKSMFSALPTGGDVFERLLRKRGSNDAAEGEGAEQKIQLMYRTLPGGGSVVDVAAVNVLEGTGNAPDKNAVPLLKEIKPAVPPTIIKPAVHAPQAQPQEHEHKPKHEKAMSALERNRLEHLEKWKDM